MGFHLLFSFFLYKLSLCSCDGMISVEKKTRVSGCRRFSFYCFAFLLFFFLPTPHFFFLGHPCSFMQKLFLVTGFFLLTVFSFYLFSTKKKNLDSLLEF